MIEEKVYTPQVIEDNPLPNMEGEVSFADTQSTSNDTFTPKTTKEQPFPTRKVAYEVLGQALNTRSKKILAEFEFTQQGAIQIGKYENGVSGDLRISPNGIVARDSAGLTTFALDGTTGDAVFRGEVRAGDFSVIDSNGLVSLSAFYSTSLFSDTVLSTTVTTNYELIPGMELFIPDYGREVSAIIFFTSMYDMTSAGVFQAQSSQKIFINDVGTSAQIYGLWDEKINSNTRTETAQDLVNLPSGVNKITAKWLTAQLGGGTGQLNSYRRTISVMVLGR